MYAIIETPENWATATQIISKVSQKTSLPSDQIEGHYCDNRFPSGKSIDRYSCVELIRYIWINQSSKKGYLVKLPKDLPSDDAFIQSFDDRYFGYVPKKIGKVQLRELAILHKKINDIEKYKYQFGTGIFALIGTAGMSVFSKRELQGLPLNPAKSFMPNHSLIDEKLAMLKDELAIKKHIFLRSQPIGYCERIAA